jgi:phospholipid transport system substrate-binding protein
MSSRPASRVFSQALLLTLALAGATPAVSAAADHAAKATPTAAAAQEASPVQQIQTFYDALLDTMKHGSELGIKGRYAKLKPVIEATFDLPFMTKIAVGPTWSTTSPGDQKALIAAFERMTISNYAHNFNSYSGEKFEIDPNVVDHPPDKLVKATLVSDGDAPVPFIHRMRETNGVWKTIDIFLNGYISELATRRSEFASTLASGGPSALVKSINQSADKLMTP